MQLIELPNSLFVKVDDNDYLSKFNWYGGYSSHTRSYIARRHFRESKGVYKKIMMHREIMGVTDPKIIVDHINHDTLDNRRENLRICNSHENQRNRRISVINSSGYKGVSKHSYSDKWVVYIMSPYTNKNTYVGIFYSKEEAALAYNKAAVKYFGEFACLNVVDMDK